MTETSTPPSPGIEQSGAEPTWRRLVGEITRLEMVVFAVIAAIMLLLVLVEPNILVAPFENERTLLFTFGGTALAVLAAAGMLWPRVQPVVRVGALVD